MAHHDCLILDDALAYVECTVQSWMPCGDRWPLYARVDDGNVLDVTGVTAMQYRKSNRQPWILVFRGLYRSVIMHKPKATISEGWVIQIYGQDRRLLCALETFHSWTFLAGLVLGLGTALIVGNLSPAAPTARTETPPSSEVTAPLALH